jgi:hypothetical protein
VVTVHDNFDGLLHKQIEGIRAARRLVGMVATPSERNFWGLVCHNLLKDFLVTYEDIKLVHHVFGPDLASIRGETVRRKLTRVITDYVDMSLPKLE